MVKPQRLQLSKAKGANLQDRSLALNGLPAIVVSRGRFNRWGNPFGVGVSGPLGRIAIDKQGACGFFRQMLSDPEIRAAAKYPEDLSPLSGHNLACWCGPKDHCHADILLEVVNA